ncbi:CPBP family intramembrane metalloprotease domain-containing protein [Paenibacillus naphthalenovorans]|uniref:CPBP family intramembrane glutamic endopeptidase n=1 Tax=Paenibacillus naphthalenovorans TaxID=162209 RepID=UPI0010B698BA|nr:type II CAAX endopeptidase family protein [Paenibacillus naphthalenovorans]GCL72932.1 CPBP family intramembrane metalloprotease domain-containing protein [Paenibacillus naphthalenovorans]
MPKRRFEPPLLLLAVLGLMLYLGVTFASAYLDKTRLPKDDAEDLPVVTKQQAANAAMSFVRNRFAIGPGAQAHTLYQSYPVRNGYLLKEQLYDQYKKKYEGRFPLEYFEVEINDIEKGATYYVAVNYKTLAIFGFSMSRTATARSESVSSPDAGLLKTANTAIREMGYDPAEFALTGESGRAGNGSLIFRSKTERIGEAPLELHLKVSGSRVTAFEPVFTVPDAFMAWQEAQDRRSALMTRISIGISLVMTLAALILVVRRRRDIRYARGALLTFFFVAIYIVNNFNMIPAFRTMHGSGPSWPVALFYLWFTNIVVGLMALSTYLALSAGRRLWLDRGWNPWPVWRDSVFGGEVWKAAVRGYFICLFILGLQQTMFFIGTEVFGVWTVSDPADSVYNMTYPGLFPLMAWVASISEEAVYRLLGIALMLKLTRSRFLAVLLPSVIWAMSHTQYPIYPVYTRLVEVTVIGLIFGYVFLKYGLLTALFTHASMNSILMGLSIMFVGEPEQVAIGAAYLAAPLAIGRVLSLLHAGFNRRPPSFPPPNPSPDPNPHPGSGRLTPL